MDYGTWAAVASLTTINALWASYYATGDDKYVRRVVDVARHWTGFRYSEDVVGRLVLARGDDQLQVRLVQCDALALHRNVIV
jgi:hypothetical protein